MQNIKRETVEQLQKEGADLELKDGVFMTVEIVNEKVEDSIGNSNRYTWNSNWRTIATDICGCSE